MTHPLREAGEKIKRASHHLQTLHTEIRCFTEQDPKPYRFVPEIDAASSQCLWRVKIESDPPPKWSLITGDFVQNLRASLDYLVWQLVLANDCEPGRQNAFPLVDQQPPLNPKNDNRRRWEAKVAGVDPRAVEFIESCQPFNGPDGPERHVLAALRDLSDQDKHRSLMPAFSAIQREPGLADLEIVGTQDVEQPVEGGKLLAGYALKDGDLVLEAPIRITGPNPAVDMAGQLPLDVAFGDALVPMEGLRQMCHAVAQTVAAADPFFKGVTYGR
jgi:hypothetical protein